MIGENRSVFYGHGHALHLPVEGQHDSVHFGFDVGIGKFVLDFLGFLLELEQFFGFGIVHCLDSVTDGFAVFGRAIIGGAAFFANSRGTWYDVFEISVKPKPMGFFDSVIPADKSASAGGQTSSAVVEPVAAPAVANDADFLIIDESVTVADVPDTVSEISETDEREILVMDEVPATAETAETVGEVESVSEVSPLLDFSSVEIGAVTETPNETAPSVAEVETTAPVSDSLDPDQILLSTVDQLKKVVSSKESARDQAMSENEAILAELAAEEEAFKAKKAELKARASEAQGRAREIDASADRARSLISSLESQLARAA